MNYTKNSIRKGHEWKKKEDRLNKKEKKLNKK